MRQLHGDGRFQNNDEAGHGLISLPLGDNDMEATTTRMTREGDCFLKLGQYKGRQIETSKIL